MIDPSKTFVAAYHPSRAYLLQKGLYALLAFDAWLVMIEHGGRYGVGGFNVAHFAWIDRLLPLPTPGLYVGSLVFAGLLALIMALAGASFVGKLLLFAVYTASWLISLHDSYQHHYLLSWLLLWSAFVPDVPSDQATRRKAILVRGWGLPMTALTCAIVYAFTGISKSEAHWRSGAVLMDLSESTPPGDPHPGVLDPLRNLLMGAGLSLEQAWQAIALSVIALQWLVALGYVLAPRRDEAGSTVRGVFCGLALLGAVSFHAFAELGHMFDIGWFSYYMLWIAVALLAPVAVTTALAQLLAWPGQRIERAFSTPTRPPSPTLVALELIAAAVLLVVMGSALDLPGALVACVAMAGLVLVFGGVQLARTFVISAQFLVLSSLAAGLSLWLAVTQTTVRFDYYRRAAGELLHMGELRSALALYRKAELYAPLGQSRMRKIREIERALGARAPSEGER